jgi:hypothetical protein
MKAICLLDDDCERSIASRPRQIGSADRTWVVWKGTMPGSTVPRLIPC